MVAIVVVSASVSLEDLGEAAEASASNLRYNPIEVLSDQKHPEGDAEINQGHFGLVPAKPCVHITLNSNNL